MAISSLCFITSIIIFRSGFRRKSWMATFESHEVSIILPGLRIILLLSLDPEASYQHNVCM